LKTGALIGFCLDAGAIMGRLPPEGRATLRGYARDVGLAFQIADDILDVEGDEAVAGKALHKDAAAGKATFLSLLGLDRAKMQAQASIRQLRIYPITARRRICFARLPVTPLKETDDDPHWRLPWHL
jgi:farnesyl diphosphate synthase